MKVDFFFSSEIPWLSPISCNVIIQKKFPGVCRDAYAQFSCCNHPPKLSRKIKHGFMNFAKRSLICLNFRHNSFLGGSINAKDDITPREGSQRDSYIRRSAAGSFFLVHCV